MTTHLIVTQKESGGIKLVRADLSPSLINAVIPNVPCELDVYVGAAIIMKADGTAKNGLADGLPNSNIIGFVESKSSSTLCTVRVAGATLDIYSGLDVAKEYYLSADVPGAITTTVPTITGQIRLKLGQPFSDKSFLVMKGERMVRS
ncbi:MAG: hypothetical protein KAG61_03625 [Bacteriovoracaceae bacterium]|nr:hypothetical protein [Bacteriovoracaceae bacterium]